MNESESEGSAHDVDGSPFLSCEFNTSVLCFFRKDAKFRIMYRCFNCRHYMDFMASMEEEDLKIMDEIDEERKRLGGANENC